MRVNRVVNIKDNSSETHWSMSSVSQAGQRNQGRNNNQPPLEDKKKTRVHTFILSESLVLVDYDRVLALGSHCGTGEVEN